MVQTESMITYSCQCRQNLFPWRYICFVDDILYSWCIIISESSVIAITWIVHWSDALSLHTERKKSILDWSRVTLSKLKYINTCSYCSFSCIDWKISRCILVRWYRSTKYIAGIQMTRIGLNYIDQASAQTSKIRLAY